MTRIERAKEVFARTLSILQLRSGYYGDGGSVWWYDDYEKEWRQITSHYFDLKDARKEYYWYAERQYR